MRLIYAHVVEGLIIIQINFDYVESIFIKKNKTFINGVSVNKKES